MKGALISVLVWYIGKTTPWGLEHGEYYHVNAIERGLYRISDWYDLETLYEPDQFEVIEDDMREVVNEIQVDKYKVLGFREKLPSKRYNAYSIDGELYEPVPIYDIVNCIAIESTESFIGKTVIFVNS